MNAEESNQLFDEGEEDIIEHLDLSTLKKFVKPSTDFSIENNLNKIILDDKGDC
jgi:hypothetical protein